MATTSVSGEPADMADETTSQPESTLSSPTQRPDSPSFSVSPSLALDAVPHLDRSVSTPSNSSASTLSTRSRHSRLSDGGAGVVRRRGYMRPQGTAFADSARNRDSVMSLGSIAHMQYYFARTGLLDGKGGQLAKGDKKQKNGSEDAGGKENQEPAFALGDDFGVSSLSLHDGGNSYAVSESGYERSVIESPSEMPENFDMFADTAVPPMLPPTVSTYKLKPSYTEPLPEMPVLRRELKEALGDACQVLEESQKHLEAPVADNSGYHEIQGLHLLDIITLAIRAAKNYYTAHSDHAKLYAIKSEKDLRSELYQVLDLLKRMASRNFRGGIRVPELTGMLVWIESIDTLLKKEQETEDREAAEQDTWIWRDGDWTGREREREWLFLKSFDPIEPPLPEPTTPSDEQDESSEPSPFLLSLQDGQRLIQLHNALIARSKRKFGAIKTWHTDNKKSYRMAENLQYWQKASQLRFDIRFKLSALDVVHGKAWKQFDEAVFKWAAGVRQELVGEWEADQRKKTVGRGIPPPPVLKVESEETEQRDEAIAV